ncbi:MAG: Holliday junction resolvase RuvX, partial [Clostridiales bacterium]|nr:Holliday junction resolvase RuvX [Clostridiales bacterium]
MKIIGLDVGDKTIGVALSDDLNITAQPLMTINRVGIRKDTSKVLELVKQYDCKTIVIGLPLNLDGTDSIQTEKVREFTNLLINKLRSSGMQKVDVVFQDERFSTVIAENALIEADLSRKKRKQLIDK